jgi:hypothetical protein
MGDSNKRRSQKSTFNPDRSEPLPGQESFGFAQDGPDGSVAADVRADVDPTANGQPDDPIAPAATSTPPPGQDIPGWDELPADVRERLLKARRDPTQPAPIKVAKQAQIVRLAGPAADDVFRTYHDPLIGWFDVHAVTVRKASGRRTYLVGERALTNPIVAQRARAAVAILIVTTEEIANVWVLSRPDSVTAESSYPYDQVKWECAEAARKSWVTLAWNQDRRVHQWSTVDLTGQPNNAPVWPGGHPLLVIEKAIATAFIDDPYFPEFKYLLDKNTTRT